MSNRILNPLFLVGSPCCEKPNPPESFDCWSLVEYVRNTCFDIGTPLIVDQHDKDDPVKTVKNILESGAIAKWEIIQRNYKPGDVALVATQDLNKYNHVGVFIKPHLVMHATTSTVMCSTVAVIKRAYKAMRVYRWPSLIY